MEIPRKPQFEDLRRLADIYNYSIRKTAAILYTEEKAPECFGFLIPEDSFNWMLVAYAGTYSFS
jgi:hypothetical protein